MIFGSLNSDMPMLFFNDKTTLLEILGYFEDFPFKKTGETREIVLKFGKKRYLQLIYAKDVSDE